MDQRGYPVDPSEQTVTGGVPEKRLAAWGALASRFNAVSLIPSQSAAAAA